MGEDRSNNINPKNMSPSLFVAKVKLLDLSKKLFIIRLHNMCAIVHIGTGYPSSRTPMGVPILE